MNESIVNNLGYSDVLVGYFGKHPFTEENAIILDIADSQMINRDFCILKKIDCNSKPETSLNDPSPSQLECPDSSKNKQCGKFKWKELSFEEDGINKRFCIALSTIEMSSGMIREVAMHDRNSCGDYGSSRWRFHKSNGEDMFDAITSQLSTGNDFLICNSMSQHFGILFQPIFVV